MRKMHNFKELKIWQRGIVLCTEIYKVTAKFPEEEKFNLISQLRKAGVSVPSNIAEGGGRNHDKEFYQFLGYARGSLCELQTQIIISSHLNFISINESEKFQNEIEELIKMINSFQNTVLSHISEPETEYITKNESDFFNSYNNWAESFFKPQNPDFS